jgi:heme oxygenase (biliverdin-IX-beta and delta-forming)
VIARPTGTIAQLWQSIQGLWEDTEIREEIGLIFPAMHANSDFHAQRAAKRMLREAGEGALATLVSDGAPYVSLVTVAAMPDGSPVLLLSKLARHTANIAADSRVSLLLKAERAGDPLAGARIGISGRIEKTEDPTARRRFLARHPSAESYAGFTDFGFFHIEMESAHLVAGFGRIADLTAEELRTPVDDAEKLLAAEEGAVRHMNEDHLDAIELYATVLLGEKPGGWKIASLDPEGCDLISGETVRRLEFPERVTQPDELRKIMVLLVKQARAANA